VRQHASTASRLPSGGFADLDPASVSARGRNQVEMSPEKEKSCSSSRSTLLTRVAPSGMTGQRPGDAAFPIWPRLTGHVPAHRVTTARGFGAGLGLRRTPLAGGSSWRPCQLRGCLVDYLWCCPRSRQHRALVERLNRRGSCRVASICLAATLASWLPSAAGTWTRNALCLDLLSALGGIRTPNLLIRSRIPSVQPVCPCPSEQLTISVASSPSR